MCVRVCLHVCVCVYVCVCYRMFVTQQVPDSNLLMLVVQADCDCSRQYGPITMEPREVKYILKQSELPVVDFHERTQGYSILHIRICHCVYVTLDPCAHNASVKCDRMRSQKVRRRPESCHAFHPQVSTPLVHMLTDTTLNQ